MKAKFFIFLTVLFCSINLNGQKKIKGNKNVTIIKTQVNSFNKIIVGEKFNVSLIEDEQASVEIETDDNLHAVINFSVADSVLTFRTNKRITSNKKLNIKISYTNTLNEIEIKGNADLSSLTSIETDKILLKTQDNSRALLKFKTKNFKLITNDKSKIEVDIESDYIDLGLNDNSKIEAQIASDSLQINMQQRSYGNFEGSTNGLTLSTQDSANFYGKTFTSLTCSITTEASSDATIQVIENINIKASENSQINLYGDPKIVIDKFSETVKLHKKEL